MAVWAGKKYKMDKSEGFDEYMKALGKFCITLIQHEERKGVFSSRLSIAPPFAQHTHINNSVTYR